MSDDNDIRPGRHCVFLLHAHLVFVTKYRRGVFCKNMLDEMRSAFASVCQDFEAELVEFDGEGNHVHLVEALSGLPWTPENHLYGAVRSAEEEWFPYPLPLPENSI